MQQPQRQHRQQREFPLHNDKRDEKDDPDDEHRDDEGRVPGIFCAAEGDGDEDEDDCDEGGCEAEEIDFFEFGFEGSGDGFEGEEEDDLHLAEGRDGECDPEYPSPLSTLKKYSWWESTVAFWVKTPPRKGPIPAPSATPIPTNA
jgi:hypothetical protein